MFDKCIIENILKFTETGSDYKNFCLVSKTWYKTINTIYPKGYLCRLSSSTLSCETSSITSLPANFTSFSLVYSAA